MTAEQQTAMIILQQLSPRGQAIAMIGMTNILYGVNKDGNVYVQFSFKGNKDADRCTITLEQDDTYTMRLYKYNRRKMELIQMFEMTGVYCDMLTDVFESATGLYLSL